MIYIFDIVYDCFNNNGITFSQKGCKKLINFIGFLAHSKAIRHDTKCDANSGRNDDSNVASQKLNIRISYVFNKVSDVKHYCNIISINSGKEVVSSLMQKIKFIAEFEQYRTIVCLL